MRFVLLMAGEPPGMGEMCITTIRHHHPDAQIVHASDLTTPMLKGADTIWRARHDDPIQLRALHLRDMDDTPTVSIDTDTLVCAPLDAIWAKPFDVALTTRYYDRESFNCGVMFSRSGRFWREFYDFMADKWGSFTAIEQHMPAFIVGRSVAKVPDDLWNCSTFKGRSAGKAKILHFKGDRKIHMREFYNCGAWRGHH